jgi:cell division transport system permease protein
MFTALKRIVRSGFIGFWRNAYVSLASIFVMVVALFVVGTTILIDQLLTASLANIQSRVDINVYFTTNAPEETIQELQSSLVALPEVSKVEYTSRADALAQYRAENQDDEITIQAIEELDDNPLPAQLSIQAQETSQYAGVAQYLEEQEQYADVISTVNYNDNKTAIDNLTNIINKVESATFFVMLILVISAVLITFNTIRLAIYTTRDEIKVMRLVGASNMYIRGPFMLQGIMYGLIAGVLTLLLMYPMVLWLGPETEAFFEFNVFHYFVSDFPLIFAVVVGMGVVLGLISSILAVARYLRT